MPRRESADRERQTDLATRKERIEEEKGEGGGKKRPEGQFGNKEWSERTVVMYGGHLGSPMPPSKRRLIFPRL